MDFKAFISADSIFARSFADLRRGAGFKIIGLNGVTLESTNIYDPKFSLINAYRSLFRQWRIAYLIGAENLKLGAKPASVLNLIKLIFGKSYVCHSLCLQSTSRISSHSARQPRRILQSPD